MIAVPKYHADIALELLRAEPRLQSSPVVLRTMCTTISNLVEEPRRVFIFAEVEGGYEIGELGRTSIVYDTGNTWQLVHWLVSRPGVIADVIAFGFDNGKHARKALTRDDSAKAFAIKVSEINDDLADLLRRSIHITNNRAVFKLSGKSCLLAVSSRSQKQSASVISP